MSAALLFIRTIPCFFHFHKWGSKAANVTDDSGNTITLVWWECWRCGNSKLKFIWGDIKNRGAK